MTPLRPLTILLAEDEHSVAFSIAFALKSDGHTIEVVADGEQALSKLIADPDAFDVLITDNNMPRMTGVELVQRLRGTAFCGKIVVLSAHLSSDNRAAYSALGVDEMMPKPFDVRQLRSLIKQIMREFPEATCDQIAAKSDGMIAGPLDPLRMPPSELCKLLKLGLNEPDQLDDSQFHSFEN